jgi:predicted DNA-binding transcriptional regulator AlpA
VKILRQAEQAAALGCSRWTVRRIADSDPSYPAQRQFGAGVFGVLESEFDDWLRSRPVVRVQRRGAKAA